MNTIRFQLIRFYRESLGLGMSPLQGVDRQSCSADVFRVVTVS